KYGADGVRTGMLFSSPAGNDLLFDEKLCEQGRNFANKIWNAFRLIKGLEIDDKGDGSANQTSIKWFEAKLNVALAEVEDHFSKYRISDALLSIYKLIWDDFCSWYLEMIKPAYGEKIDQATYDQTIVFLEKLMKMLHPFMPFITEEIYQDIIDRKAGDYLMVAEWPAPTDFDSGATNDSLIIDAEKDFDIESNLRYF